MALALYDDKSYITTPENKYVALRFMDFQNRNRVTTGFFATRSPVFGHLLSKSSLTFNETLEAVKK